MNNSFSNKCAILIIIALLTGASITSTVVGNTENLNIINKENEKLDLKNSYLLNKQDNNHFFNPKDQLYGISDEIGSIYVSYESDSLPFTTDKNNHMNNYNPTDFQQYKNYNKNFNSDIDNSKNLQIFKLSKTKHSDRKNIYEKTENKLSIKYGKTLYVGGIGPNNYTSIQDAIDVARSQDTVFVYDDSSPYYENITIDKSINLIGENSKTTIIDGSDLDIFLDTVNITADNVFVSGFSIVNNFGYYYQAAILITGNFVTITDCIIFENSWIGIFLNGASNCQISNCELFQNLISIYLIDSNKNDIFECLCYENAEDILLFDNSHNNKITNCSCYGNTYSGIHIQRSSGNLVANCTCEEGYGGIGLAYAPNTILQGNIINNNYKNFGIGSTEITDFYCDIDTTNKINGKPIYYWINNHNTQVPADASFIGLISCSNIIVNGFDLEGNFQGIVCAGSSNCTIQNCNFQNNDGHGIFFIESKDNVIKNCYFEDSFFSGIYLNVESNRNIISNNTFIDIRISSIWIEESERSFISGNGISNSLRGISFDKSGGNILRNNEMTNCGISVDGYHLPDYVNDVDITNKINQKTIYYYLNEDGIIVPSDAGQVILVNCTNFTISNLNLSFGTIGIELAFSSNNLISENEIYENKVVAVDLDCKDNNYNTIEENIIHNNSYGIDVDLSDFNNLLNNTLNFTGGSAFSLDSCTKNNILDNEIYKSYHGIYLYGSDSNEINRNKITDCGFNGIYLLYSRDNKLKENKMDNCGFLIYGAYLSQYFNDVDASNKVNGKTLYYYSSKSGVTVPSDAGEVILVNCNSCTVSNLDLSDGTIGLEIAYSYHNTISDNTIKNNKFAGIYLESSSENTIEKNTIEKNSYGLDLQLAFGNNLKNNKIQRNTYGCYIYLSDGNIFFRNNIYYNGYGIRFNLPSNDNQIHYNNLVDNGINAWDENEKTNSWYDKKKGNYWGDYKAKYPDARKIWLKGIWNTPYDIPGEENQDLYPLILPSKNPRGKTIYLRHMNILKNYHYLYAILRLLQAAFS